MASFQLQRAQKPITLYLKKERIRKKKRQNAASQYKNLVKEQISYPKFYY